MTSLHFGAVRIPRTAEYESHIGPHGLAGHGRLEFNVGSASYPAQRGADYIEIRHGHEDTPDHTPSAADWQELLITELVKAGVARKDITEI